MEAVAAIRVWIAPLQTFCFLLANFEARVLIAAHTEITGQRTAFVRIIAWTKLTDYNDDGHDRDCTDLNREQPDANRYLDEASPDLMHVLHTSHYPVNVRTHMGDSGGFIIYTISQDKGLTKDESDKAASKHRD